MTDDKYKLLLEMTGSEERTMVLDADMLLFRGMSRSEVEVELAPFVWTRHSDIPSALTFYWDNVHQWCEDLNINPDKVAHCFTHKSAWRRRIYPNYKASRKDKPKPIGYGAARTELMQLPNSFCFNEIEADDLLSIFARIPGNACQTIVASGDKDLDQVPGWHVWLDKEPWHVTDEDAERFTYQQYLSGDSTDGIPGCKGVGATTAPRLVKDFDLKDPVGCWEAVVRTYQKKGEMDYAQAHEYALTQARLVRVLRYGEYDFNNFAVKPWTPPTRQHSSV